MRRSQRLDVGATVCSPRASRRSPLPATSGQRLSDHATLAEEGDGARDCLVRLALVDLEDAQGGRRQPASEVLPLDVAPAGCAVVADAVDVVQVAAERARTERIEPGALIDVAQPRLHLRVADIVPVADEAGGIVPYQRQRLVRQRKLVVVEASFQPQGDAAVLSVGGQLRQRFARPLRASG